MERLSLPKVTLCAAASVNVAATLSALEHCLGLADFGDCLLFTDVESATLQPPNAVKLVPVARMGSAKAYSEFLLDGLVDHVRTSHCLIVQWDGFIIDPRRWKAEFLECDYIGAPWPQFRDGHDVGNGGFSLRSRRLLEACRDPGFVARHPEDVAIGRTNRNLLEQEHGIRFADRKLAEQFAYERTVPAAPSFGFHGIFNMIAVLGADRFWAIYRSLDDRGTIRPDYRRLMRQLGSGPEALPRRLRLTIDRVRLMFGAR